jgi:bacterioferritin
MLGVAHRLAAAQSLSSLCCTVVASLSETIMLNKSTTTTTETKVLRRDASQHLEQGAVTTDYEGDRADVIRQLNQALATELVCLLRYRRDHFMARGIHSSTVAAEFLAHSNEELAHADSLAARIVQLGGEPDFAPHNLESHSHAEYTTCGNLDEMIRANLVAERVAIHIYRETIHSIGDNDPTTQDLLRRILAVEEEHATDLANLLGSMPKETS